MYMLCSSCTSFSHLFLKALYILTIKLIRHMVYFLSRCLLTLLMESFAKENLIPTLLNLLTFSL